MNLENENDNINVLMAVLHLFEAGNLLKFVNPDLSDELLFKAKQIILQNGLNAEDFSETLDIIEQIKNA